MEVEKLHITIPYGDRKKLNLVGEKFKAADKVHYWFEVHVSKRRNPVVIVLYDSKEPGKKFTWYYENDERNHLADLIARELEKTIT